MTEPLFKNARSYRAKPEGVTCGDPASRVCVAEEMDGTMKSYTTACPMDYDSMEQAYFCIICGMKVAYEDFK